MAYVRANGPISSQNRVCDGLKGQVGKHRVAELVKRLVENNRIRKTEKGYEVVSQT
ncbi:MAG: hypothetical protein K2X72_22990 [Reyranella sp.]|nr:hypothetical protein [Reyranella sp.]